MHFSRAYGVLSALSCLTMSALATSAPSLKHAFSVHVDLGQPVGPIPNPIGGFKVVEPITGGTISGPSFAGTVASGGASAIDFNSNFTIAEPFVEIWGTTDDGKPFFVQATGIGEQGAQLARITVGTTGKYAALDTEFILATFTDDGSDPPKYSTIEAWIASR